MKAKLLTHHQEAAWNGFIPKQFLQYDLDWQKAIHKLYKNCIPLNYLIYDGDKVVGVFASFLVKSRIFGNRVISHPFVDNGGIIGHYDFNLVLGEMKHDLPKFGVKFESIRNVTVKINEIFKSHNDADVVLKHASFHRKEDRQQFILHLDHPDRMWEGFHKHIRNDIRMAEKSELQLVKIDTNNELKSFYGFYVKAMKSFGTPQHSLKYFRNINEALKEKIYAFNCYRDGVLVGCVFSYLHGNYCYVNYNFSDPKFRQYRPNEFLYWNLIKEVSNSGAKFMDFGQVNKDASDSHSQGLFNFKKKWGAVLYTRVEYNLNKPSGKPDSERYNKLIKTWKKMPLIIVKRIGPRICSQLGK